MMETIALLLINLGINMIVVGGLFWLQYGIKNRKGPSAPSPIPFKVESKTTVSPVNQAYRFLDWHKDNSHKVGEEFADELGDIFKSCLGVIRGGIVGGESIKYQGPSVIGEEHLNICHGQWTDSKMPNYDRVINNIKANAGCYQPITSDLDDNNPPRSDSDDKPSAPYRLSREAFDSLVHISSNKEIIATDDPKPPQDRFVVEDEIPNGGE